MEFNTSEKWLLGWADIVENELVGIFNEFAVVLNNIYLVIFSSQKVMFQVPIDIHGNANASHASNARCHGHELLTM